MRDGMVVVFQRTYTSRKGQSVFEVKWEARSDVVAATVMGGSHQTGGGWALCGKCI